MSTEEAPRDLRMPISRVRSSTAVYIAIDTTMKPTMTAIAITLSMKLRSRPMLLTDNSDVNSSIE